MRFIKMLILCKLRKNAEKRKVQSPIILVQFGIISWHWWYNPIITDYTYGAGKPLFLCPETAWKRPKTTKNNDLDHFRDSTKMMHQLIGTNKMMPTETPFEGSLKPLWKAFFHAPKTVLFDRKTALGGQMGGQMGRQNSIKKGLTSTPYFMETKRVAPYINGFPQIVK